MYFVIEHFRLTTIDTDILFCQPCFSLTRGNNQKERL